MCDSEADLIEIRHVGVTAKIKSPLKRMLPECSTAETENEATSLCHNRNNTTLYSKFTPSDETETTCGLPSPSTEESKLLYEMHAERGRIYRQKRRSRRKPRNAFTKIEFKLHKTAKKLVNKPKFSTPKKTKTKKTTSDSKGRSIKTSNPSTTTTKLKASENSFVKRLRTVLSQLFAMRSPTMAAKQLADPFNDLEQQIKTAADENYFYPFERGCADYMRTTDSPPDLISDQLAERANRYATRFWAEFFGVLNIGASLVITFVLQSYRFVLFALVHTLLAGLLRMTADYLLKPLLASLYNGFIQPIFLLCQNVFSSLRDALEPVADALHNFMKPFAYLFGSLRLVDASKNEKFVKEA